MSSVEPSRHALYSRLEEVLGSEHAETLMTRLPRNQADEVATKGDIVSLEARFDHLQRTLIVAIVGSMTALTAVFSLVVGLLD